MAKLYRSDCMFLSFHVRVSEWIHSSSTRLWTKWFWVRFQLQSFTHKYFRDNMAEDVSLAFRLRKIDETKNYLLDEIKQWFNKWKV